MMKILETYQAFIIPEIDFFYHMKNEMAKSLATSESKGALKSFRFGLLSLILFIEVLLGIISFLAFNRVFRGSLVLLQGFFKGFRGVSLKENL